MTSTNGKISEIVDKQKLLHLELIEINENAPEGQRRLKQIDSELLELNKQLMKQLSLDINKPQNRV